jgi:hypothetical protein
LRPERSGGLGRAGGCRHERGAERQGEESVPIHRKFLLQINSWKWRAGSLAAAGRLSKHAPQLLAEQAKAATFCQIRSGDARPSR